MEVPACRTESRGRVDAGVVPTGERDRDRRLKMAHRAGGWTLETVDANGDAGEQNSLGMYNGVPYIAYYHTSNKDLQFMMWKP